ncbi:hypothetical protein HAX54_043929 [Datura stramonium]|uniref:Uncharacterized protein n=1 Tax=Datura stramonium TaxID=4076 RepID=A0ABS8W330_DATST|nr:hypothetical protein [Datura stramonium]
MSPHSALRLSGNSSTRPSEEKECRIGRVPPGKASRLLPKSGHRPVMRLVEDSLPIPSGVGTNKESRKQLPAIKRSTSDPHAKGRSAYSLR